jgi:L-ascorbate metabolism protein UlaG (beta-lactamase superfamily)
MIITYLGHSCFKLKSKVGAVITDPYHEEVGWRLGKQSAQVVTVSHGHPDHNASELVSGAEKERPFIIDKPGEYEVGGISVFGTQVDHDDQGGTVRGSNIIFSILMENLNVCHLGDLGHSLTPEQVGRIGEVDVLLCPIGGVYTIDYKQAIEVMNILEPKIFIPMHYQVPGLEEKMFGGLAGVAAFTNEYGVAPAPVAKLEITKDKLPEETEIVILERS